MTAGERVRPRVFFLNDQHELSREDLPGGGGQLKLGSIDWAAKSRKVSRSLREARQQLDSSGDPLRGRHYFLLSIPESTIPKRSESKTKPKQFDEPVKYAGKDSRVLGRLGVDTLAVADNGSAIVHATPETIDKLITQAAQIADLGSGEQATWAFIGRFSKIPAWLKVDAAWLNGVSAAGADTFIEFQPLISRGELTQVLSALYDRVGDNGVEAVRATGRDFSGRAWCRATLRKSTIRDLADDLFSIQAIHRPLLTPIALSSRRKVKEKARAPRANRAPKAVVPIPTADLPTVGVVDCGVPSEHLQLADYRRGTLVHPESVGQWLGDHGSLVASRVVFGDPDFYGGIGATPPAEARFLDIVVADSDSAVQGKNVVDAIERAVSAFPDVRVFNLSFGDTRPLTAYDQVERREKLFLTQDLDNLVFARDIIVVVAAGNSGEGVVPKIPYPRNFEDADWGLSHWAAGFNTLSCGSFIARQSPDGLVQELGAPSPFCRVGPGVADGPTPEFSAPGGNASTTYRYLPDLGVFALNAAGVWEDHSGTSFAAPLLAKECAVLLRSLQRFCPGGVHPAAALVKAFLALTAERWDLPTRFHELARRTLGFGRAHAEVLQEPERSTALFVWQGVLDGPRNAVRLQIPVPLDWLKAANAPWLEFVIAWDSPVNGAAPDIYGCRKVNARLRTGPSAGALRPSNHSHPSYPIIRRRFDLAKVDARDLTGDLWLLEISYEQIAEYSKLMEFSPQQRIGLALELRDASEVEESPQAAVQAMPISESMTRLSVQTDRIQVPVIVRARISN